MKWTFLMPVLNEANIIEARIKDALEIGNLVVVEGAIPTFPNDNGLSIDGTSEILKSYSDRILYIPARQQKDRIVLQNIGMLNLHKQFPETDILARTDADEFFNMETVEAVESQFRNSNDWVTYVNMFDVISKNKIKRRTQPLEKFFPFSPGVRICGGMYPERFYRYRPDLHYQYHDSIMADGLGIPFFAHPNYYFNRSITEMELPNGLIHYRCSDSFHNLIKKEMNYLAKDAPMTEKLFLDAKSKLQYEFSNGIIFDFKEEWHPKYIKESPYYNEIDIKLNWDLTYIEFLEAII
jgi:hypothetical protein